MKLFKGKRILAAALAFSMVFAFPVPQAAQAETVNEADQQAFKVTREPKRLFAKAVSDFEKAQKGELKLAVSDLMETDVYYEALTADEKLLYDTYAELYNHFDPYSSSDEFNDKATSGGGITVALADDILSGKVLLVKLSGQYTREQRQEIPRRIILKKPLLGHHP